MDDVRRQDRRLFVKELLSPARVFLTVVALLALLGPFGALSGWSWGWNWYLAMIALIGIVHTGASYNASLSKRFLQKRYEALWNGCVERLNLFDEVLAKMQKDRVADLQEMPRTIRRVSTQLYSALRRADMISHEVQLTERGLYHQPPAWTAPTHDAQATELYRLADKNIAEYRMQFAGVMAGVQRTEGQCAVFMTTVDSLRMKMIGYRLVGRQPELSSHDFLEALAEARLQLSAIDQALDELDLGVYPKTISVVPPPSPFSTEEKRERGSGGEGSENSLSLEGRGPLNEENRGEGEAASFESILDAAGNDRPNYEELARREIVAETDPEPGPPEFVRTSEPPPAPIPGSQSEILNPKSEIPSGPPPLPADAIRKHLN